MIFVFWGDPQAYAEENYISAKLLPSVRNSDAFEIGEIQFVGNKSFSSDELFSVINTKQSDRSFPHKVLQAYHNEFKKNRAAPRKLVKEINIAIKSLEEELSFFDRALVETDTFALWHYYNTHGFHHVRIGFSFFPDLKRRINILRFKINEGLRFSLDTVVYRGLDSLSPDVALNVKRILLQSNRKNFNEMTLVAELNAVHNELLNNGYYHASYTKPDVNYDTTNLTDSVTFNFNLGRRYTFGNVFFVDSTRGQHVITREMKRRQLEFKEGMWYSRKKVQSSIDNLLSIGTFESVSIDTCNQNSDSVLNFCVQSIYRKHREWGVGIFTNHTQLSNYNAGVEGSVFHRNLFGMAQSGSVFSSIAFKDIGRLLQSTDNFEYELQMGFRFTQPLLWTIDNTRVSFTTSLIYSVRTVNNFFQINTLSFPVKFPVKLPKRTYFNSLSFDFIFERENPVNFVSALSNAYKNAQTPEDSLRYLEAFYLYNNLNTYLNEDRIHIWTSNTMGFSLVGDNKNNPYNPNKGTYTFIGFDGWNVFLSHPSISGIARFFRFQFLHSQYFSLGSNLVGAYKARLGSIYLMDEANSYVPIDKQFFAGGSNSVRGWSSRTLRYTNITKDSLGSNRTYQYMQNFIGSGGLIEGSFELRYKFSRPPGFNKFIAEHIGNIGITAFVDFGNAFHWYLGIENTKVEIVDYFTKLAVAGGLGFHYNTPVGPIRVDFATPFYDPLGKENPFGRLQFHVGLGHAF